MRYRCFSSKTWILNHSVVGQKIVVIFDQSRASILLDCLHLALLLDVIILTFQFLVRFGVELEVYNWYTSKAYYVILVGFFLVI